MIPIPIAQDVRILLIVTAALQHRPDVPILDIDLLGVDGPTAPAELHKRLPECRRLILTGLSKPRNLRRALAAHVGGFMIEEAPVRPVHPARK